jgi:hypothetical protein
MTFRKFSTATASENKDVQKDGSKDAPAKTAPASQPENKPDVAEPAKK